VTSSRADRRTPRPCYLLAGALAVAGLACGGSQRTDDKIANTAPDPSAAPDSRSPIERRRDAACDQLGPRLTDCAVDDARAALRAGKITQSQFGSDTAPALLRKHTEEYLKACKASTYSSRQVRVLEVCFRDASACGELLDCLDNLKEPAGSSQP
jgi:hypothetical protein